MIHHISIGVKEPERVARVLAELWNGYALPFPVAEGSWIAMTGDANGTTIEVMPMELEMTPGVGEPTGEAPVGYELKPWEVHFVKTPTPAERGPVHAAIASPLTEEQIHAIARREGWRSVRCDRGPAFPLVEVWLENRFLVEVLPPAMGKKYTDFMTPAHLAELFGLPAPQRLGA